MSVIRFSDIFEASEFAVHSKELSDLGSTGVCFYTDGGYRRTLPVPNASWGIHSYFYKEGKPKKSSRYKLNFPTKEGYTFAPEEKVNMVNCSKLLNLSGLIHLPASTNNIAELQAVILAIDILIKTDLKDFIKSMRIFSDSQYVLNGINLYLKNWIIRGWRSSTGAPIANVEYWKVIETQLAILDEVDVDVVFEYRPGHVDYGNVIADSWCSLAMSTGIEIKNFCDEEWYMDSSYDVDPLMLEQRYIHFPGLTEDYEEYVYQFSFIDSTIPVSHLGCRVADQSSAIINIKGEKHIKDLKTVHRQCVQVEDVTIPVPMVVDLKNFFSNRFKYFLDNNLAVSLPQIEEIDKTIINDPVDDLPVFTVIAPARNSFKALDEYQKAVRIFKEADNESSEYVCKTDITDIFYKTNDKGAGEFVLKMEEAITVEADYQSADGIKKANVILTMGLDMPKRRVLFNIVGRKPRISVVTWELGEFSFRYGVLVETETASGLWFSPYSNTHLILQE